MTSTHDALPTVAIDHIREEPFEQSFSLADPDATRPVRETDTPERALASSPILRGNELSPLHALSNRPSPRNSYRNSSTSSFRLSKDLGDLRWDGSPLREDDSMVSTDDNSNINKRNYHAGSESEGDASQQGGAIDQVTYSSLSKRADFILANAKKKLNMLEGNLGRARHSLVIAPQVLSELNRADSSASTRSAPFLSRDQDRATGKGPKINFGAPRSTLTGSSFRGGRSGAGHSRVFSDTSIPSQSGTTPAGSRSLDSIGDRELTTRHPLHKQSLDIADGGLDSVPEDRPITGRHALRSNVSQDIDTGGNTDRDLHLQTQADLLRHQISYLQSRSRENSTRRRSHNSDFDIITTPIDEEEAEDDLFAEQGVVDENGHTAHFAERDARAEWQRVLEQHHDGSSYSGSYIGDDRESDDVKLPDALADELLEEQEQPNSDQPHETRNDAFDYEHFILHSIMGSGVRRANSSSTSSASVEHDWNPAISTDRDGWIDSSQLGTHEIHTADEGDASASGSESERDITHDDLTNSWPVPPSARNSTSTKVTPVSTSYRHQRNTTKPSRQSSQPERRPESEIVSRLISHSTKGTAESTDLAAEDKALFYAVAESLREVCLRLQQGNLGPHDGVDLRQRLEIARRVLKGEL